MTRIDLGSSELCPLRDIARRASVCAQELHGGVVLVRTKKGRFELLRNGYEGDGQVVLLAMDGTESTDDVLNAMKAKSLN